MTKNDLPDLRRFAANGQITYSKHALQQMLARGCFTTDVENILKSSTNQLIEIQSPSVAPGHAHKDPRYIIADPNFTPDTAVVITLDVSNPTSPQINIVTVERALSSVWDKDKTKDPWLTRK